MSPGQFEYTVRKMFLPILFRQVQGVFTVVCDSGDQIDGDRFARGQGDP